MNVLVAETQAILRLGLRDIFIEDPRILHVYEALNTADIEKYIAQGEIDLIIIGPSLIEEAYKLTLRNFVVLTYQPRLTELQNVYQRGARGYFSVDTTAELLRTLIHLIAIANTFLIEPTFAPDLIGYITREHPLPSHEHKLKFYDKKIFGRSKTRRRKKDF